MKTYALPLAVLAFISSGCNFRVEKPSSTDDSLGNLNTRPGQVIGFKQLQRNLFEAKCSGCHNAGFATDGVDVSSFASTTGNSGLIVPGNPEASRLFIAIGTGARVRMPTTGAYLSENEIAAVRNWIQNGAPEEGSTAPTPEETPPAEPLPEVSASPSPTASPSASPTGSPSATPSPVIARVTYEQVRDQVLQPHCALCHGSNPGAGGVNVLALDAMLANTGLIVPGNSLISRLSERVSPEAGSRQMPPQPRFPALTAAEIELVKNWIDGGALSESSPVTPPPVVVTPPPVITPPPVVERIKFSQVKNRILDHRCISCHGSSARINMTSFATLSSVDGIVSPNDPENSRLYTSILSTAPFRMPADGSTLEDADIQFIKDWISQGASSE